MASTKINGTSVLVYLAGTKIGAQRGATLNIETETFDVTTKDSAGWREILCSTKSWSLDCDGLLTYDETPGRAYDYLYSAFINKTLIAVKISNEVSGDDKYFGDAYVTSAPQQIPDADAVSYSLTLTGTGALTRQVIT